MLSRDQSTALIVGLLREPHLYQTLLPSLTPVCFDRTISPVLIEAIIGTWKKHNKISRELLLQGVDVDFQEEIEGLLDHYWHQVAPCSLDHEELRELASKMLLHHDLMELAYNTLGKLNSDNIDVLEIIRQLIASLTTLIGQKGTLGEPVSLQTLIVQELARLRGLSRSPSRMAGLSTGYPQLDALTSGLVGGEVWIIAARPSVGKTSFALNLLANFPVPSLFFSLEMSARALAQRLMNLSLGVNLSNRLRMAQDDKWVDLEEKNLATITLPSIWIDETSDHTPETLLSQAVRIHATQGIGLIALDYLQLVRPSRISGGGTRDREIAKISATLKQISRDLQIPVVVLSQLNRGIEQRKQKSDQPVVPELSDLRDSGTIEQDADIVAFLTPQANNELLITISKNRNGPLGNVVTHYNRETSQIT